MGSQGRPGVNLTASGIENLTAIVAEAGLSSHSSINVSAEEAISFLTSQGIDDPQAALDKYADQYESGNIYVDDLYDALHGGSAMSVFNSDYGVSFEDSQESGQEVFDRNMENFPKISDAALDNALSTAPQLDQFMSDRFFKNIEKVLPNWKETIIGRSESMLDTITDITASQLKGEVPQDVQDFIMRTRAEQGISQGLFGESASYATARDLGRTSADFQQQGISNAVSAVSPLTARLLDYTKAFQPPTSDPTAIYGQGMGALSGVNLTSVLGSQQMQLGAQQFNQEMAYAQALGQLNYDQQQQQLALQTKQFEDAQSAQFNSMILGTVGSIMGTAIAGPLGGAVGGWLGGSAGGSSTLPANMNSSFYPGSSTMNYTPDLGPTPSASMFTR